MNPKGPGKRRQRHSANAPVYAYHNNIVERDHRAIKRITRPMLSVKSFRAARNALSGIELMHMIRKGKFMLQGSSEILFADQFMRWQEKSDQFEKQALVPAKITFIASQCDTTGRATLGFKTTVSLQK